MSNFFIKHSTHILILFIPILFIVAWLSPSVGMTLLIIFLSLGFFINCLVIIKKHREPFLQGKTSRIIFIRNVSFETLGILLVMILAGLLGNYLGKIATRQISNDLTKFIAGIFVGLLVGIVVGMFVQRITKKLLWVFQKSTSIKS